MSEPVRYEDFEAQRAAESAAATERDRQDREARSKTTTVITREDPEAIEESPYWARLRGEA